MIAVVISAVLGVVIAIACISALAVNEHRYDWLDRMCLAGLAGSMLLTTPALFLATPFDAWSFNLSRMFLAGMCVKRFLWPIYVNWRGAKRQAISTTDAARRLHDRAADWF